MSLNLFSKNLVVLFYGSPLLVGLHLLLPMFSIF